MKCLESQVEGLSDVLILAEKRRELVFSMVDDLKDFAMNTFGFTLQDAALEYLEPFHFDHGMELKVFGLYIWWSIFTEPVMNNRFTIFQLYYKKQRLRLKKRAYLRKVLASWHTIRPGFYEIKECVAPRVFTIEDLYDDSIKEVSIYNQIYEPAAVGDIVTGIIFPLGDGTYTCLFDFLQLPREQVEHVLKEQLSNQVNHQDLLKSYPAILRQLMYEMMARTKV